MTHIEYHSISLRIVPDTSRRVIPTGVMILGLEPKLLLQTDVLTNYTHTTIYFKDILNFCTLSEIRTHTLLRTDSKSAA